MSEDKSLDILQSLKVTTKSIPSKPQQRSKKFNLLAEENVQNMLIFHY